MKRRKFFKIAGAGLFAIGGLAYWQRNPLMRFLLTNRSNESTAAFAAQASDDLCVLMPEQPSGPYYADSPMRSVITEDRPGLSLKLDIEVVQLPECMPLEGATVEIWHCDAQGYYSGYSEEPVRKPFDAMLSVMGADENGNIKPTESATFLRGGQVSDENGRLQLQTIFPGWYDPRVAHIHVKVSHKV